MNSLSSNDYFVNAIIEGFLHGAPYNATKNGLTFNPSIAQSMLDSYRNQSLISLNVIDCIIAYGKESVSKYSNPLLVYEGESDYNSLLIQSTNFPAGE